MPKTVTFGGTVRTFSRNNQQKFKKRMLEVANAIAASNHCTIDLKYEERYPPTINSKKKAKWSIEVAAKINGSGVGKEECKPVTGSEDFGFMLQKKKGCYALIGNGDTTGGCMLHSPTYDFNDTIIPQGISYWVNLVQHKLGLR